MSQRLQGEIQSALADQIIRCELSDLNQVTVVVSPSQLIAVCLILKNQFQFEQLVDLCGIDYAAYGNSSWEIQPQQSFSRAVAKHTVALPEEARFAVIYQLLSLSNNQRLRLKVPLDNSAMLPTVIPVWNSANWFEREAFDMFGILFEDHPDLRRILTDYGFIGHPFRKDFPLSGHVEMRYDDDLQRVIYEPVSIEERTLVPRVIRNDSRYEKG